MPKILRSKIAFFTINFKNININKEAYFHKWIEIEFQNCPEFILEQLGEKCVLERIEKNLEESYRYTHDLDLAQKNADFCQVQKAKVEDYLFRQIDTPLGSIVTSIRFMSGDLTKPYVLIVHKDFELQKLADIWTITSLMSKEYNNFKPQRVAWSSNKLENELIEKNGFLSGDMVYVSEFLNTLKKAEKPANYEKVKLKKATNLSWFETYKNEYENLFKENPIFIEMAQITDKKTMQSLIEKKLLFEVFINKEWAGVIGANTQADTYFSGYCVYEELLIEKFRGQKLAAATQRHLIELLPLPPENNEMLYGTIHYDNIPSLKTAQKVGRSACGMIIMAML